MDFLNNLGPEGSFLQSILSGGFSLGKSPSTSKKRSGFELDAKNRIKVNPETGEKIKPKDRRKFKRFKRNPFNLNAGNSLNMNVPNILTGENLGQGSGNLASILGQAKRLGA